MGKGLRLPSGYRMVLREGLNIAVKEGYAVTFKDFVMPQVSGDSQDSAVHHGRSQLVSLPLVEDPSERILIRRYVRGGIPGRFLKETYLKCGPPRPLKELEISEYARAQGIATPEVLAAAFERVSPFFYRGAIAVREVAPSSDLQAELLADNSRSLNSQAIRKKRRMIDALGRLIAKMHAAGIYHADLHLKNVLLAEKGEQSELYLLDLDAAKIFRPLSDFRKCMNLLRLFRSVQKVNRRRQVVTRGDVVRFLRAYTEESSRSARELLERLKGLTPFWRLKWKLSDLMEA